MGSTASARVSRADRVPTAPSLSDRRRDACTRRGHFRAGVGLSLIAARKQTPAAFARRGLLVFCSSRGGRDLSARVLLTVRGDAMKFCCSLGAAGRTSSPPPCPGFGPAQPAPAETPECRNLPRNDLDDERPPPHPRLAGWPIGCGAATPKFLAILTTQC